MKFDPNKIIFKPSIIDKSGLNLAEFKRVLKLIYCTGIGYDEKFNEKITKTIEEPKSQYMVHLNYIWRKDLESDILLDIKYVKKMKCKRKISKWGKVV